MRQLAVEFGRKTQPFRTAKHFQQLADALNGAPEARGCNVTVPAGQYGPRVPSFKLPDAGTTVYVDAVKGKDTNTGTKDSPFQTIDRALKSTRSAGTPSSIVLREGTHYQRDTIVLTPQDNDLTIQNAPGEEVWISGAVLVKPTWKPYKVNNESEVVIYSGQNNVFGKAADRADTKTIKFLGEFNTLDECQKACLGFSRDGQTCKSFTYHTPQVPAPWTRQCFAIIDHEWAPVAEPNIISGQIFKPNIYVADLASYGFSSIPGLRINTGRSIRARYPNADPEFGFGSSLLAKSWLPPNLPTNPDIEINPNEPLRDTSDSFRKYQLGIGGPCKNFVPPAGYWCGNETEGGGHFTYRVPTGFVADKSILPNSPYKNPVGAIVQAWRPARWASWMFEVGSYDAAKNQYTFSRGGYQGARGENSGENFYIENVFEELDSPNEWFYDQNQKLLYLWFNGTAAPPADTLVEVVQLKTLLTIQGTQKAPAKKITIQGVNFKDSAYTYMDPHGMPSGGDWALQRSGALYLQGTENITLDSCIFSRLDGNGVLLSAYNRYATIQKSEFVWIGDTAIAAWGNAKGTSITGMGWDGTDGDQPRFTQLLYNFVHELGIWEKQSSFYFQAKSCQNTLKGNIFFNGPRAGINFNDGFGGASTLSENLVLNTCRESGDHGPFNSWDRQVYITEVRDGKPSTLKDWDHIFQNFMIANYQSQEAIDNDDGSCYYETHHNFFAYSGNGMKSDFGGHDNRHHDNIYAYVGTGFQLMPQLAGHEDYFYSNQVILEQDSVYGHGTCSGAGKTVVHDNKVYSPNGRVSECGMTLAEWQAKGNDPGTTAQKLPEDQQLVEWIKALLSIP